MSYGLLPVSIQEMLTGATVYFRNRDPNCFVLWCPFWGILGTQKRGSNSLMDAWARQHGSGRDFQVENPAWVEACWNRGKGWAWWTAHAGGAHWVWEGRKAGRGRGYMPQESLGNSSSDPHSLSDQLLGRYRKQTFLVCLFENLL